MVDDQASRAEASQEGSDPSASLTGLDTAGMSGEVVGIVPRPAIFLDRDGTINVEVNYLHRPDDLTLISGVPEAIRRLNLAGLPVIVVTNQAGIARGYYDVAALHLLHDHLSEMLAAAGAHLDAFFFCPHHPDFTGACDCRKPAPGMLLAAARRHGLDLGRSWLVGDTAADMAAGQAAGCRTILVRTGYGAEVEQRLRHGGEGLHPEAVVNALPQAVDYLLTTIRQASTQPRSSVSRA